VLAPAESARHSKRPASRVSGDDDVHAIGLAGTTEILDGITGAHDETLMIVPRFRAP
jgi:hypothetical protein